MARVKCVMMQRDEKLLLAAWFRYYGYLFGFENLVVFDNGSVDEEVVETLRFFERAGSQILWEHKRVEDFHAKGSHFRNIILHWDWKGDYDFAIPLDCDEFIALFTDEGLSCSKLAIHHYLDSLIGEERALSFGWSFYNVVGQPGAFWPTRYPKSFLAADTVHEIDHGFHAISSRRQPGTRGTYLTYLHMHNKPFAILKQHAIRKLELFTDVSNLETLKSYDGPGLHLVPYFFMDEDAYKRQSDDKLLVEVPNFANLMTCLGIRNTLFEPLMDWHGPYVDDKVHVSFPGSQHEPRTSVEFDGADYLDRHVDVREANMPALLHFIEAGHLEKRHPTPASTTTKSVRSKRSK